MSIDIMNSEGKLGIQVFGDLYFRLINSKNGDLICRFARNTAFVDQATNTYTFDKAGVDPDSIIKCNKFDPNFKIVLTF